MLKITVIIPALNEAGSIRQLVHEVRTIVPVEVIVVDNGSTDSTAEEAKIAGAQVVSERHRGYGYACAAGVAAAKDSDVLVFMDGDGCFLPSDLPALLSPLFENRADMVLGSRERGYIEPGAMPSHQRFGNWLASRLMNLLYGLSITDLGPYRVIRRSLLIQLNMQEMTYGWPTEMIVKSARRDVRIVEVPVRYRNRRFGQSKVSGTIRGTILAGWYILGVTIRYAWKTT
jgi:glycosyltransferase involved in cell wall biosynthesis